MPLSVYLDTQDYSRFADVLLGRSDRKTEDLFRDLERRQRLGDVIFPVSMPILAELLQYDERYRETALKRAEAVERLSAEWALAYPSRLVATQIAEISERKKSSRNHLSQTVLSNQRVWYPDIGDVMGDLSGRLRQELKVQILGTPNMTRPAKRAAISRSRKIDLRLIDRPSVMKLVSDHGFPASNTTDIIFDLLAKKISSTDATKLVFREICKPTVFVEIYFEKIESDKSLPQWMKRLGLHFHESLESVRDFIVTIRDLDYSDAFLESFFIDFKFKCSRLALDLGARNISSAGASDSPYVRITRETPLAEEIPSGQIFGALIPIYIKQVVGLLGPAAKMEQSFGGDLIHSLYLPYVDLWRGDRRFSELVKRSLPIYREKVVSTLNNLTSSIDEKLTSLRI